jgi:hypothetical protein
MTGNERHITLSDEAIGIIEDALRVVEELDSVRPSEMTELFYAAHYWDLMISLREVLNVLGFGEGEENQGPPDAP